MSRASRLFHPLCGSNLTTLLPLLAGNGPLALNRLPAAMIALSTVLLRWPFSAAEHALLRWFWRRYPPMQAPVFIIGYWRSGTTHLHNVLSQSVAFGHVSPLVAGLPWDMLGIARALAPVLARALPRDRYVDSIPVTPDSPQEDSIALANMLPLSYYHGLYFPKRFRHHFRRGVYFEGCRPDEIERWRRTLVYFLQKVSIHQHGKQLLLKNPVYTGHVARLRAIWPEAKFIHIYRSPYVLFPSTRHFFTRLFSELAFQRYDNVELDELILESYPKLMNAVLVDAAALPASSYVEVRFEDFQVAPMRELETVYRTLELPGFKDARQRFETYLASVRGYRTNRYRFDREMIELVEQHWSAFIRRWGYDPPASAGDRLN